MEIKRRSVLVFGILAALWVVVAIWQVEEHIRVRQAAKADLRNRSKDIANTLGAFIRGLRFRGAVLQDRLEPVLNELVYGNTNDLLRSSGLISIVLLNAANEPVASAGRVIDFQQKDILQEGEHWGRQTVTLVNPVDLGALTSDNSTNPTVIIPLRRDQSNGPGEGFRGGRFGGRPDGRFEGPPPGPAPAEAPLGAPLTNPQITLADNPGERHPQPSQDGEGRGRRPRWGMDEKEFQAFREKRSLHGVLLALSIESFEAASTYDLWLRSIIMVLATISVAAAGLAWRSLLKNADLQIRLIRASELNTHLKEMNVAAAGLAHETRNPLNIIRGRAQQLSRQGETSDETRQRAREIIDEADKVAAQLNEFINYSRPREVRRVPLALGSVVNEVVRALSYDLEEKKISLQFAGEPIRIEADEQLIRQALFNLLLNAAQAVDAGGEIRVLMEKRGAAEAMLQICDNGPGVPPERRTEIFKPYFTTQKTGTGLGLAVVQQIVLAHGWEIQCLPNEPKGACFRISHLKLAPG
jgi:signal transduction histidine kinase